jgi:Na+/proline symporter
VASSAITRDFYQQIFHPNMEGRRLTALSRNVTLVMALIALAIAMAVSVLSPDRTIFWFVIFGWSGIAATFCPTIILSLFWKDFTENGAIAAMIAGFVTVPITKFILATNATFGVYFEKLDVMAPSFAMGLLAGYIASKLDKK